MTKKKINTSLPGYFTGFTSTLIHLTVGAILPADTQGELEYLLKPQNQDTQTSLWTPHHLFTTPPGGAVEAVGT